MSTKRPPIELPEWRSSHLSGTPHKVLHNWALRVFVDHNIRKPLTFEQLAQLCREKFGPQVAPSKSALQRYWEAFHRSHASTLHQRKRRRTPRIAKLKGES